MKEDFAPTLEGVYLNRLKAFANLGEKILRLESELEASKVQRINMLKQLRDFQRRHKLDMGLE